MQQSRSRNTSSLEQERRLLRAKVAPQLPLRPSGERTDHAVGAGSKKAAKRKKGQRSWPRGDRNQGMGNVTVSHPSSRDKIARRVAATSRKRRQVIWESDRTVNSATNLVRPNCITPRCTDDDNSPVTIPYSQKNSRTSQHITTTKSGTLVILLGAGASSAASPTANIHHQQHLSILQSVFMVYRIRTHKLSTQENPLQFTQLVACNTPALYTIQITLGVKGFLRKPQQFHVWFDSAVKILENGRATSRQQRTGSAIAGSLHVLLGCCRIILSSDRDLCSLLSASASAIRRRELYHICT